MIQRSKITTFRKILIIITLNYNLIQLNCFSSDLKILGWIVLFSVLGSVGAILAAASFILLNQKFQKILISILISYAIGILLTASLFGLIPEAIEGSGGEPHFIMLFVLGGILFFFIIEKIIIWRNCQNEGCEVHSAAGPLVLVGDAFHNFTDGVVIAAAFLTNFSIGIVAGISVLIHEIPQETGDFGILLHQGYSRKKALLFNILSSLSTIPAAIISFYVLDIFSVFVPYLLAISAASFIYIALTDLTPELHQKADAKHSIRQILLIFVGILTMAMVILSVGHQH
ncbi:MAG: ZIP family metal transporter [Candidatus Thorarchaeota archaeon]